MFDHPVSGRRMPVRPRRIIAVFLSTLTAAGMGLGAVQADAGDPPGTIRTVAGKTINFQQQGFSGDGGPATAAQVYHPRGLAFGPDGDAYIADAINHRIRRIAPDGIITTIAGKPATNPTAGSAVGGFGGDGGPATEAQFDEPHGIAVDSKRNIYIADSQNNRLRKIDAQTGIITTISGTGNPQDPSVDGPAEGAGLKFPKSMFMTADDVLYLTDMGHNEIRKIDLKASPLQIVRVAGNKQARRYGGDGGFARDANLNSPKGVWVTPDGIVYISDSDNNLIRKVTPDGRISTIAGDVTAAATAAANNTYPIRTDSAGDNGPANKAHLNGPRGIAMDKLGNLYVAEEGGARIRRIDPSGIITTIAGTGVTNNQREIPGDPGPSPALEAAFNTMHDLNVDSAGNLWIADSKNNRVRVIFDPARAPSGTLSGTTPTTQPGNGNGNGNGNGSTAGQSGYWMLGVDGKIYPFGDAEFMGDATAVMPAGVKATHVEPTPSAKGYWIVDDAGRVYGFGDAPVAGSPAPGQLESEERVTSLSATPSGQGYWLFTTKGRVLPFGDAAFFGDMSAVSLNGPVQSSIASPSGQGYYMVASDGGVFAFGDAVFQGSMGDVTLNQPVESLVPTRDNLGYWLVASDGGIFAFGAPFEGSMGDTPLSQPVVGMVRYGSGYLMVASDGGIFNFSDRPFLGSLGDSPPAQPITFAATLDS